MSIKNYDETFCDLQGPLDLKRAQIEASRCYYCYDAPCITACPTGIDIPSFIRKISNKNIKGAALDILSANIMGGTCSRACPVETLCQEACVREKSEAKPVLIGELQRYATDEYFKTKEQPFKRAPSTGKKVAVVGAGPAGLSCAHKLATLGHDVVVYEAKEKAGGLNEYGLAPYKMTNNFAQKEIEFILSVGGIKIETGKTVGKDISLSELQKNYSAVFLGTGLNGVNSLNIPGEELPHVLDAVRFIAKIRQTKDLSKIPVGQNVVVIGGGNTAVDIAIQMKKLGAEFVTLVYRRGTQAMGATVHEQELAQLNGVLIKTWMKPTKIDSNEIEFEYTESTDGKFKGTGKFIKIKADQIFKAIGQTLTPEYLSNEGKTIDVISAKIGVNENFETSVPGIFAGGDVTGIGEDLTVTAVQQGKLAALAIHKKLGA